MTDDAVLATLASIAAEELAYAGPLTMETPLIEALRLDSIRMLTLVTAIENRLELCFDIGDEESLTTVGDLVALIRRRKGG